MTLRYLIEKEFKQTWRNPLLPRLIVIFPCVMLLIMPWAANSEITNINICIVDNDHSTLSVRLSDKVSSSRFFRVTGVQDTYDEAMRSIERGDADMILEIPPLFERDLMRGDTPQALIAANSVDGTKAGLGSSYVSAIVAGYAAELRDELGGKVVSAGASVAPPSGMFSVLVRNFYNPYLDFKFFMVPALMVMLLTMICGFMPALNIVNEKETGTIEQINVTPVSKFTFIMGKLIPYWIIGFIVLSVGMLIALTVYGYVPAGSVAVIYLFALIYILIMTGMGLVVSNSSSTMQQAMFVMFFFVIVFILMSGLFTPIQGMPDWAKAITTVNPLKYFIQVMRAVYLRGSALADLIPQLLALVGFAVFFNTWAVLSYRKSS